MNILESVARTAAFTPATTDEYFALQLAKRLGDEANLQWHLRQPDHYTQEHLLSTMQRTRAGPTATRAERYRNLLS